jgi:hypothetical protein
VLDIGLSFLVYLSPLILIALLTAALGGNGGGFRYRRSLQHQTVQSELPSPHAERVGPVLESGGISFTLASDAERDDALQSISCAVGEGRLSLDDAVERIDAVLRSRHRHQLNELTGDLPVQVREEASVGRESTLLRPALLVGALLATFAAVVFQIAANIWELWPVAVAACGLLAVRPRR